MGNIDLVLLLWIKGNHPTSKTLDEIEKNFSDPDVGIYYFKNGNLKKPSAIIDLNSMEYVRE